MTRSTPRVDAGRRHSLRRLLRQFRFAQPGALPKPEYTARHVTAMGERLEERDGAIERLRDLFDSSKRAPSGLREGAKGLSRSGEQARIGGPEAVPPRRSLSLPSSTATICVNEEAAHDTDCPLLRRAAGSRAARRRRQRAALAARRCEQAGHS